MNSHLQQLKPYPFARLREAMQGITPPAHLCEIPLYIGEPKHPTPQIIKDALINSLDELSKYPLTLGLPELRQACADWLKRRYDGLTLNPETEILPVLGSREALFSFVQATLNEADNPVVISPNPFYQIYEGATLLSGGEIVFANTVAPRFLPDWDSITSDKWARCKLVFVCSPDNPTGSVLTCDDWKQLFDLQDKYGFIIAADECYSEIYFDNNKPIGCLQAAAQLGRSFGNIIMFTSLSKRSNVPGLRSGFVAGDAQLLKDFFCIALIMVVRCHYQFNEQVLLRGMTKFMLMKIVVCTKKNLIVLSQFYVKNLMSKCQMLRFIFGSKSPMAMI